MNDYTDRYKAVRDGVWWRVKVGDGERMVGGFFTKTEAESMAAALLTAFNDGRFVGEQQLAAKDAEIDSLKASVYGVYELEQQLAEARGHMRLYRLFNCEGGDSYDPECAEKNLDKVMEILSK